MSREFAVDMMHSQHLVSDSDATGSTMTSISIPPKMDVIGSVGYELGECNSRHDTQIQAEIDACRFHPTMFSSRRHLKSISNGAAAVPSVRSERSR